MSSRRWRGLLAIAATVAALSCSQAASPADRCRSASRDEKWPEAVAACRAAADGQPAIGLLLASALEKTEQWHDALSAAEGLFGTPVDAGARQLAGTLRMQQDQPAGEELLRESIAGHLAASDHASAARAGHVLARELLRQRRMVDSLEVEQRALADATRAGNDLLRGKALLGLVKIYTALGDERQARRALVEAGPVLAPWPGEQTWVFLIHGLLLLQLGDAAGAVTLLTRARELAARHKVHRVVESAGLNLAYAERMLGHLDAAQAWLDRAAPDIRNWPSAAHVDGLIAADRGDRAAAERFLAVAATAPSDDDYAADIAYQRGRLAERRGDLAAAEAFFRESIATVEKIRDRAQDLELRGWVLRHRRPAFEALFTLLAGQRRLTDALEVAERLHARTWIDSQVAAASTRASAAGHTKDQRASAVEHLAALHAASRFRSGRELLDLVGDREALVFVEAQGVLWRFRVADRRVAELAPLPPATLDQIDDWTAAPDDTSRAERLGAALIPPGLAAGGEPLYIVAGDHAAALPFAALRRSGRTLVDMRPLIRLPGLAALECRPGPLPAGDPIFLGDPLGDLPAARGEAERAASAHAATASVGGQATVARLYAARDATLLHIATHADVDEGGGVLTLADGRVTALDLVSRQVAPGLAVLAGCATAASSLPESWGSLASGFLAAGTRTVVATLRPVADADAAALIDRFYRAGGARRPAFALAAAQRELARSRPAHEWAAFAAWGAPEPSACAIRPPGRAPDVAIRRDDAGR